MNSLIKTLEATEQQNLTFKTREQIVHDDTLKLHKEITDANLTRDNALE